MSLKVYYWKTHKNFGDLLAPLLLKRFTHLSSEWAEPQDSKLIMVGSILEHMPDDWKGIIAGCGVLHEKSSLRFPLAQILSVRGPLTIKVLGLDDYISIGDPGLLAHELVGYKEKIYDLGIVPHWTDKTLEHDPRFLKYSPKIIRVSDDPLKVIEEIASCKKIISSSLHGIILADAYDIPRRIEISPRALSHPHHEGGLFKWEDYSASIDQDLQIGITQEVNRNKIIDLQHGIFDTLEHIKEIFTKDTHVL